MGSLKCLTAALILLTTLYNTHGPAKLHAASPGWNNGQIKWMSFAKGMQKAQKTGRPALVVFEARWCKVCKTYRKLFFKESVVAMSKKMVMIMVNIEKNRVLQKRYSPDGGYIPRTMAFSPAGYHYSEIISGDGKFKYFASTRNPADLLNMMRQAMTKTGY